MKTKTMIRLLCLLLLAGMSNASFGQAKSIPVFKMATTSQLNATFTDKNVTAGRQSLFIFFDITCGHCQEALSAFNRYAGKLNGPSIYLITRDPEKSAAQFLLLHAKELYAKKNTMLLLDKENQFIERFRPVKYPSMFLYSATRKLELYSNEPADVLQFIVLIKKK